MADITEIPHRGKRKNPIRELVETLVLAVIIALVIRSFVVEVYHVEGPSMESTLHTGQRVLVNKLIYRLRKPQPGDIVVFQYPKDPERDFIKRVVAVAGDRVELREGKVYVNGRLFPEAPGARLSDEDSEQPEVVPMGSIWVLGDNRVNSDDSRMFGSVSLQYVRGEAFFRIWPLGSICRFVNPVAEAASDSHERGLFACP